MPIAAPPATAPPTSDMTAAAATTDAQVEADRTAEIGAAAPMAEEALEAATLGMLGEAIADAAEALSGGQIPVEAMEYTEPADQVPPQLFAYLSALGAFFGQVPEGEPFAFDPFEAARSNAGLKDAAVKIAKAGKDKALIRAMRAPATPAPQGTPQEEEAPPPDKSRFVKKPPE
jgi:hypothetical protein